MAQHEKCEPPPENSVRFKLQELGHHLGMVYLVGDSPGRFAYILRKIANSERVALAQTASLPT